MILVIDVGNTNMVMGVYDGEILRANWRRGTNIRSTADELGMFLVNLFIYEKLNIEVIEAVIISSVVPNITYTIDHCIRKYFKLTPMILGPGVKTGINIKTDNPREVGADRIANAAGACEIYGGPIIIVDFGTATTFCAITSSNEYLGGVICTGVKISSEALFEKTAKLPRIEIVRSVSVIGKTTVAAMQAGVFYGYVGQVDYIVNRMKREMKEKDIKVIATGGLARMIADESETIDEVNGLLTLQVLRIIYEKNIHDSHI